MEYKMKKSCWVSVALLGLMFSCTDVDVFETPGTGKGQQDNKLSVAGTFCTEHPDELAFPVKIMFIIDCSQSMNVTDPPPSPDEYSGRVAAVWEVIQKYRNDPGVEFAMVRFESAANVATQRDTNGDGTNDMFGFVNDLPALLRALNSLQAAGGNTSYQAALGLAEATLAMDMSNNNVDERARTKYVIIFLSDGLPYPVDYDDEVNTTFGIRRAVREMMNLGDRFDVAEMTFHTAFLGVNTTQVVQVEAETLLRSMAEDGSGTFRNFDNGENINFLDIDFTSVKRMYSMKDGAFVVTNASAHPGWDQTQSTDTDGDGLVDRQEFSLGTAMGNPDTDGDGFNDLLEYNLRRSGFDPLDPDDADCTLVLDRLDDDGDGLLNCEERFIGTSPDLFDSDSDGLPDPLEVRMGTNPVWADADVDMDFDGSANHKEIAWHMNPAENDANRFSKLAYRYQFGRRPGIFESRLCYDFEVENITLMGTLERQGKDRAGYNDIMVYTGQTPYDDPEDVGTFRVACARVRYIPRYPEPDIKYPPNGKISFEQKDFKRPTGKACSSDAQCPHHVCDPNQHLCLSPLGATCDENTPCPPFKCQLDVNSGKSYCAYPVPVACMTGDDCPAYPTDPVSGSCLDAAGSTPDPLTGLCPRRECIPLYDTCTVSSTCPADGDLNPGNDPQCIKGFCRVACADAGDCHPGETCEEASPGSKLCVDKHGGNCARVGCTRDSQCPLQICDEEVGRCRSQPCLDSRECPYQHCELALGFCMGPICQSDGDCRGERGFTCTEVVGDPCERDIDCPYNFCTVQKFSCSLGDDPGDPPCVTSLDCPRNFCQNDRCTKSGRECDNDLQCVPNTCRSFYVCENDEDKGCDISIDCPQTFCKAGGTCLNNPAQACDPASENIVNACKVGTCSRADALGRCDTQGQESCATDEQCPSYRCNPGSGLCDYPIELSCKTSAPAVPCPAGLDCNVPGGAEWGVCQKNCLHDTDCPKAHCLGRCRPLDAADQMRCTDWFDADRDCVVYDES
jgi:hypothetical protein